MLKINSIRADKPNAPEPVVEILEKHIIEMNRMADELSKIKNNRNTQFIGEAYSVVLYMLGVRRRDA